MIGVTSSAAIVAAGEAGQVCANLRRSEPV
jgi:hypothetical protein